MNGLRTQSFTNELEFSPLNMFNAYKTTVARESCNHCGKPCFTILWCLGGGFSFCFFWVLNIKFNHLSLSASFSFTSETTESFWTLNAVRFSSYLNDQSCVFSGWKALTSSKMCKSLCLGLPHPPARCWYLELRGTQKTVLSLVCQSCTVSPHLPHRC